MKITCPACNSPIRASQMNVATDVAVCEGCQETFSISSVLGAGKGVPEEFDQFNPPRGAWFEDTGVGWRVGSTTRSAAAFFLVPFMCVWSGFSLGGIYGMQIVNGEFNLFLSLFGIPFLLGTLLFGSIAVMTVCGRTMVTVEGSEGRIFAGVGPVGWTRRFDWSSITAVEEDFMGYYQSGSSGHVIALVGQTRLKFGSMLNDARRYYVLQVLRRQLGDRR